jgi:L-alanine-DL-glutamate epimerase-like enolase superfamily enzyme
MTARPDTRITEVEAVPLDVALLAPFTIASSRLEEVRNVALRLRLACGVEGWAEIPALPGVTYEDQATALDAIDWMRPGLEGRDAAAWRQLAVDLELLMPEHRGTRAAIEIAALDALTRAWRVPLFEFLGGASNEVVTDITIPICLPEEARTLAERYRAEGFATIKTKVGLDLEGDVARLLAIRGGHPDCVLVLDANEGFTSDEALRFLDALRAEGIVPGLFEQPVAREDWEGLGRVTREGGVPVAADESCRSPADALRVASEGLATVLNIKLAKSGVLGALEIAAIARAAGLGLMIGAMVETRLGLSFGAHFAAGVGGFEWIDLDTALLLADDPIVGGYVADGPRYTLSRDVAGHGAALARLA